MNQVGIEYGFLPDDPKFIKVAPTTLSTKRLFKCEDHTGNVVSVPDRAKDPVGKSVGGTGKRLA